MERVLNELRRQKEMELQEIKKDNKNGIPIRINPKSYVAKEILYQTFILKGIERDISDIKRLLKKSNLLD